MAGGLALSLGNMICQYAWAFVGLSLVNIIVCCMIVDLGKTKKSFFFEAFYILCRWSLFSVIIV